MESASVLFVILVNITKLLFKEDRKTIGLFFYLVSFQLYQFCDMSSLDGCMSTAINLKEKDRD